MRSYDQAPRRQLWSRTIIWLVVVLLANLDGDDGPSSAVNALSNSPAWGIWGSGRSNNVAPSMAPTTTTTRDDGAKDIDKEEKHGKKKKKKRKKRSSSSGGQQREASSAASRRGVSENSAGDIETPGKSKTLVTDDVKEESKTVIAAKKKLKKRRKPRQPPITMAKEEHDYQVEPTVDIEKEPVDEKKLDAKEELLARTSSVTPRRKKRKKKVVKGMQKPFSRTTDGGDDVERVVNKKKKKKRKKKQDIDQQQGSSSADVLASKTPATQQTAQKKKRKRRVVPISSVSTPDDGLTLDKSRVHKKKKKKRKKKGSSTSHLSHDAPVVTDDSGPGPSGDTTSAATDANDDSRKEVKEENVHSPKEKTPRSVVKKKKTKKGKKRHKVKTPRSPEPRTAPALDGAKAKEEEGEDDSFGTEASRDQTIGVADEQSDTPKQRQKKQTKKKKKKRHAKTKSIIAAEESAEISGDSDSKAKEVGTVAPAEATTVPETSADGEIATSSMPPTLSDDAGSAEEASADDVANVEDRPIEDKDGEEMQSDTDNGIAQVDKSREEQQETEVGATSGDEKEHMADEVEEMPLQTVTEEDEDETAGTEPATSSFPGPSPPIASAGMADISESSSEDPNGRTMESQATASSLATPTEPAEDTEVDREIYYGYGPLDDIPTEPEDLQQETADFVFEPSGGMAGDTDTTVPTRNTEAEVADEVDESESAAKVEPLAPTEEDESAVVVDESASEAKGGSLVPPEGEEDAAVLKSESETKDETLASSEEDEETVVADESVSEAKDGSLVPPEGEDAVDVDEVDEIESETEAGPQAPPEVEGTDEDERSLPTAEPAMVSEVPVANETSPVPSEDIEPKEKSEEDTPDATTEADSEAVSVGFGTPNGISDKETTKDQPEVDERATKEEAASDASLLDGREASPASETRDIESSSDSESDSTDDSSSESDSSDSESDSTDDPRSESDSSDSESESDSDLSLNESASSDNSSSESDTSDSDSDESSDSESSETSDSSSDEEDSSVGEGSAESKLVQDMDIGESADIGTTQSTSVANGEETDGDRHSEGEYVAAQPAGEGTAVQRETTANEDSEASDSSDTSQEDTVADRSTLSEDLSTEKPTSENDLAPSAAGDTTASLPDVIPDAGSKTRELRDGEDSIDQSLSSSAPEAALKEADTNQVGEQSTLPSLRVETTPATVEEVTKSKDDVDDLKVSVVTWNLAEESPLEEDALFIKKFRKNGGDAGSDLVLISGQECENIKPRRTEGRRSREYRRLMVHMLGKDYVPVALHLLGGIQFGLFCKRSILHDLEHVSVADVTCGIGNVFHNKGAIAAFVTMKSKQKSESGHAKSLRMLFVTAHMAAHVKNTEARNADFWRIASELEAQAPGRFLPPQLSESSEECSGSYLMDSMDRIFFCGDLNYRLDLPRETAEHAVVEMTQLSKRKDPEAERKVGTLRESLLRHDQLKANMAEDLTFPGFAEGPITFAPTFKYDKGSNDYDTSPKQRIPAWTDRILFKPRGTRLLAYDCIQDAHHSDHRPVYATFRVSRQGRELAPQKGTKTRRKKRSSTSNAPKSQ